MMVHGHPGPATNSTLFLQSFLNGAASSEGSSLNKPVNRMPIPSAPAGMPMPPGCQSSQHLKSPKQTYHKIPQVEAGSGFLYNLLTSSDSQAVQRRSAFLGAPVGPSGMALDSDFPRRSYSMSVHRVQNNLPLPNNGFAQRPSSVPRGVKRTHNGHYQTSCTNGSGRTTPVSPSNTYSSEEPLDLSCIRMPHEPISDTDSNSSESSQPLLRNILSRVPQLHSAPIPAVEDRVEYVQLAKKTVLVVHSHISDWLKKGSDLIQTNNTLFGSLDKNIQVALLSRTWPRILQLYMAENNFHFAVSPVHDSLEKNLQKSGHRLATKQFSERLQRLISFAAALPFDTMTYNLLRLAAIFKADPARDVVLDEVQEEIMKHVKKHLEMKGIDQHYAQAEELLNAVTDTDKDMLETLFCNNLLPSSVDDYIRAKLAA